MDKNRGSEWRKWDLHLHSLYTNLSGSGSYKGVNEDEFIRKICDEGIKVVGLTNYINFKDEDYKLADKMREQGITTFLNLEIRLTNLNDGDQLADYHIIFSDELSEDEIKLFLANLEVTIGCSRMKANQVKTKDEYSKAAISFDDLQGVLGKESLNLKGKYLSAFLSRGSGNAVCGKTRSHTVYEEITRNSDILLHSSTLLENLKMDREYWLGKSEHKNKYIKALLQTSDAHSIAHIGYKKVDVDEKNKDMEGVISENGKYHMNVPCFTWIKADTTFEGLKQIIFEPEERVYFGVQHPEQKSKYLVIDNIEYYDNEKLYFNSGMNAIIGGRSTGKSTLLNSIAHFQNNKNIDLSEHNCLKSNYKVEWSDGEVNQEREVEFIPQEFMINISKDHNLLNDLLNQIISRKGMDEKKIDYNREIKSINQSITHLLNSYFETKASINELIKPEGDIAAVKKSVKELSTKITSMRLSNKFTEEDEKEYRKTIKQLEDNESQKVNLQKELKQILGLKIIDFSLEVDLLGICEENALRLKDKLEEIRKYSETEWKKTIVKMSEELSEKINDLESENSIFKNEKIYIRGKEIESQNLELKRTEESRMIEKRILQSFENYNNSLNHLNKNAEDLSIQIVEKFLEKLIAVRTLSKSFEISESNLLIKIEYLIEEFERKISYLDIRKKENRKFIDTFKNIMMSNNKEEQIKMLSGIFSNTSLTFNQNKNLEEFIEDLFLTDWFNVNYIITYQNDEFSNMSQGKKSFVILKLLLEFSDDKKPVLIDQPEDSLDNKAIYHELRKYLLDTKKERQIIVVTHNPNIVVGSDAENIIVANQHNELEKNRNNMIFQYINGSLENTQEYNDNNDYILETRGIREHIFDILEGGEEAFTKREQKYNYLRQ